MKYQIFLKDCAMNKKILLMIFSFIFIFLISGCSDSTTTTLSLVTSSDSLTSETTTVLSNVSVVENDDLVGDPSYIKWEGRYEYKGDEEIKQVALYHTATGFTVDFYGTELKVSFIHTCTSELSGTNIYYNFSLDDETIPNPIDGRTFYLEDDKTDYEVTIISGLTLGHHTIKCLKMDEAKDAYTSIYRFKTDGYFYERDKDADNSHLKFMFICASGGSGFGSLGYTTSSSVSIERTRANSSSLHAFNYLAARMYDADTMFIASSGWGLVFDRSRSIKDVFDYTGVTVENNVEGAKKTALWDHTSYIPDVIIFNIGGNDTTKSSFILNEYKAGVIEIVEKLHTLYPNAVMLWTRTKGSNCGTYAMNALRNSGIYGEGYIKEVVIPQVGDDGTYGASSHNSFLTHITTASKISQALEEYFNLKPTRENVNFDDFKNIIQVVS